MKYTKETSYYDPQEDYHGKEKQHYHGLKALLFYTWDSFKWLWWAIIALLTLLLLAWVALMVFTDIASPFLFIYNVFESIFGS